MPEFAALRLKRYSYLIDDGDEKKERKDTKNVSQKESLNVKIINMV